MFYANRVKCSATGTGNAQSGGVTLAADSAIQGFRTPQDALLHLSNRFSYLLKDGNGTDWELGSGTLVDAGLGDYTLTRSAIIESTNNNARIVLSDSTHTFQIVDTAFHMNSIYGRLKTTTAQSLTNGVAHPVQWSSVFDNVNTPTILWASDEPAVINFAGATGSPQSIGSQGSDFRISGQISFAATSVAAGRYELDVMSYGTTSVFHTEVAGSTTDVTYLPFDFRHFSSLSVDDDEFEIHVTRVGDDTGAGLYTSDCVVVAEVLR